MYLAHHPLLLGALHTFDALSAWFPKREGALATERILLCNGAHLGDLVLATTALKALRDKFPASHIGFLSSEASSVVLQDRSCQIHTLDHWKLDRSSWALWRKVARYRAQRKQVLQELRGAYDVAIDLYPFFPNHSLLLWQARIPVRIGYESGGGGPLFTHPHRWQSQHVVAAHFHLLKTLGIQLPATLPSPDLESYPRLIEGEYGVIHMGCGDPDREWPLHKWKELIALLEKKGLRLVFTAKGQREQENIRAVGQQGLDLGWKGFCAVVAHASFCVGVESAIGHVASAYGVPTYALYQTPTSQTLWKPVNPHLKLFLLSDTPELVFSHVD
jgi:ADP-heptose:LPS heptosyltransferase